MKDDIKDVREFGFGLLEVGMALVVIAFAAAGLSKLLTANADDTVSQWEAVLLEKEPRMLEPADVIEMTGRYLDGVANAPVLFVPLMEAADEAQWIVCSRQAGGDIRFAEVARPTSAAFPCRDMTSAARIGSRFATMPTGSARGPGS
jgi:hypothetical protein